jgi:hypothetical protein
MGDTTKIQDHSIRLAVFEKSLTDNTTDTKEILTILKGDNGAGLCTKVALNRSSINRAWWWLAGVSICILGVAGYVIKLGLVKG